MRVSVISKKKEVEEIFLKYHFKLLEIEKGKKVQKSTRVVNFSGKKAGE